MSRRACSGPRNDARMACQCLTRRRIFAASRRTMPFCLSAFADLAFDEHIHYMLGQFSPDNPITNTFLTVNGAEGVVEVGQHGSELWVRHVAGQPPIVRRGEMQLTVEDDASMVLQPDDEISLGATAEPILVTLVGQSRRSILGWLRALGSSFLPVAAPPSLLSARSPSPPHDEPAATDDPTDASETTGLSALTPAPPRFGEASTASVAADPTGSGAPYTYRTPAHPQPRAGALGVGGAPREASHGSETTCGSSHETAALRGRALARPTARRRRTSPAARPLTTSRRRPPRPPPRRRSQICRQRRRV